MQGKGFTVQKPCQIGKNEKYRPVLSDAYLPSLDRNPLDSEF